MWTNNQLRILINEIRKITNATTENIAKKNFQRIVRLRANAFISIRYGLPKSRKTRNCIMYYEFSAGFWKNQDILIPLNRDLNTGRDCQSPPPPNVTQAFF
ncbi:unnamed protein product [Rhizophagus irregularis]|nr:unnamed protein product [Rhizophagus irregularis]